MATIDSLDIQIAGSVKKANNAVNSLVKNLDKLANSLKIDTSGLEKIGQAVDLSEISNGVKDIQKQMSGFEKSTKSSMNKVSKTIEDVLRDAKNIGKGFRIEGNFSAIEKGLQKYTNELERAKLKEKELSAKGETDTNKYRDVIVDIQKYSNIIESLNRQIESMKPVESQLEINTSGLDDAKKSLDDFARELEEFRNDMKANEEVFGGLSNAPIGTFETEINNLKQTIEELKQSFPNATQVISEFEKELQKLEGVASGLTKEPMAVKVDTSDLDKAKDDISDKIKSLQSKFEDSGLDFSFEGNSEQLEKEIQKAKNELDNLFNKQDRMIELGKVDTDSFKGVIRDIENAANRLKILEDARPDALNRTLEETQKKAKESEAALGEMNAKLKDLVVPPIREDNIEKLQAMLKKAEEELDRLREKLKNGLTMGTINQSADDKGFQNLSAQIAVAEKRAGMLRQKIQDIGGSSKSTAGLEVLSSALQGLGQAAGKASTMIKNALKGIASVVSGAFSKIGQIGSRTASTIKNVASNIASSFAKIGSSSKSLKTAHSNLRNLLKTALGFATLRGVFNFAKEAVNLGSSITEVENVVNTAFGSMAQHAYDFASTAAEQFGLSELAAKQYSGTMMAMLKSSGVAQAQAAKMSTTLAGLAGDIASFYNLETDEAFYKLRSAISGETEPMKALGVNMNIVNLEAFAMSQGINKAYREMTLAEQATLRYNYIMAKTTDAQGDFAKTSGNFANQWRLLKMNIQSVAAVLGQGIIAGILPIIKALNALMGKLMQAAKAFRNFMYVLMGKKIEATTSGIVNDLGGIGDAAGNLGELGDEAEEAGRKINKNLLLPIDELNILTDTSDDLKDALGGIGDVDMGMGDAFEGLTEEPVNEWAKRIRDAFLAQDWEELGKTIAELVNIGLKKVYDAIIDITPKVEKALKAFAEVFNSFVKYLDWDLLGRTIGAGINLITTAINALLGDDGIDFEQLGSKLSVGFRGMIDEIDWMGLGNAIGNWFMVAWRIADGFIQDMWRVSTETMKNGWEELGEAVGEGVNGVFDRIQFDQIARVLTEGFRGIIESAASALDTIRFGEIAEKINAGLAVLENGLRWEHVGEQITKFTSAVSKAFNDLLALDFGSVGRIIGNGITDIVRAFNQLTGEGGLDFERLGANISNGLRNLFASIPWTEFGNALGNGFMIGWRILDGFVTDMSQKDGAGIAGWAQLGISLGNAINGVFEKIDFASIANILTRGFNGLVDIIANFASTVNWDDIANNISSGLNTLIHGINWKNAGATLNQLMKDFLGMLLTAARDVNWEGLGRGIGEFLSQIDWGTHLETVADIIAEVLGGLLDGLGETPAGRFAIALGLALGGIDLASHLFPFANNIVKFLTGETLGQKVISGFKTLFGAGLDKGASGAVASVGGSGIFEAIGTFLTKFGGITALIGGIITAVKNFIEMIQNGFSWLNEILMVIGIALAGVGAVILGAPAAVAAVISAIVAAIATAVVVIKEHWEEIKEFFANLWQGIKDTAVEIWNSISEFLGNLWQGIRGTAISIWNGIGDFFSGVWDGIRTTAETVWNGLAEFLGNAWNFIYETAINAWNGIRDTISGVWDGVREKASEVWNNVTNYLSETWENIKQSASEKFEAIKERVSNAWGGAREKAREIWDNVSSYLSEKWESIKTSASEKFSAIKEKISGVWENAKEKALSVWGDVSSYLLEKWESIKVSASEKFMVIREKVSEAWSGIREKTSETWNGIKESLSNTWENLKTSSREKFEEIKTKISNAWDETKKNTISTWDEVKTSLGEKIPKIVEDVKGFFSGLPNEMLENGRNILNGLMSGITEKTEALRNKIKEVAGNVSSWFKEKLDIHSPSGVFEDIAKYTFQGFMNGADKQKDSVKNTMSKVAQSSIDAFDGINDEFGSIGTNMISSMDKAVFAQRNVMANQMKGVVAVMKDSFNGLDNAFSQIGSNIMNSFMNAIGGFGSSIQNMASNIGSMFSNTLSRAINFVMPSFGGQSYSYSVPAYAAGGLPEDGWFRASHGEMIGKFDNGQSVVANNTQIVDGIKQGVKEAVSDVLAPYLADIAQNTRETADKDMSVRIGDRDIHDANKRAEARLGWTF